jgi:curli biogenesis system outer membrane secretion channel CsgG
MTRRISPNASKNIATPLIAATVLAAAFGLATGPARAQTTTAPVPAIAQSARTKRMAFVPAFQKGSDCRDYTLPLGKAISDMLTTELSNRGIRVLERQRLNTLETEGELGLSGVVDPATAQPLGQKLGAHWAVIGTVTQFSVKEDGARIPVVNLQRSRAQVTLDVRVSDVRTGEILTAVSARGEEKGKFKIGTSLIGFLGNINFGSEEWLEGTMGKAVRKAASGIADQLASRLLAIDAATPLPAPATPDTDEKGGIAGNNFRPSETLRGLRMMVVVPETILQRPAVPDPAAETEIIRQLTQLGLTVLDDQRIRELRADREVIALARGTVDPVALEHLRSKYGADVIIVGEALAQRNDVQQADSQTVFSRARVEIRALRLDNGQILAADAEHAAGRDLSETLSCKLALSQAARALAPRFIKAMDRSAAGSGGMQLAAQSVRLELEIGGWRGVTQAQRFLDTVASLPGITRAEQREFRGGILFAEIQVDAAQGKRLALLLESHAELARFNVMIETASGVKIVGAVQTVQK